MKRPPQLVDNARQLRRNLTDAERRLWSLLRNRRLGGYKFRRQYEVGGFILDFYCVDVKLAIEVDGGGHAEPETEALDERRTQLLRRRGIEVLRFWNHDVLQRTDAVVGEILRVAKKRASGGE